MLWQITAPDAKRRTLEGFCVSLASGREVDVFPQYQLSERFPCYLYNIVMTEMVFPHGQPFLFS